MERDAMDKEAVDTAGKNEPGKDQVVKPTLEEPASSKNEHDELLPTVAPTLIDAPEKKIEKPVPPTPTPVPTPPSGAKFKTVEALAKAVSSLYSGNAVAEAAKTADTAPLPKETPAPEPQTPAPTNPATRSAREIGLEAAPAREITPPPKIESVKKSDDGEGVLPRVRTYANDISTEIRKRNTTLTSIVGAEQQRTLQEGPYDDAATLAGRKTRTWLFVGGAVLLLVIGIGSIGAAFLLNKPAEVATPARALIPVNHSVTVEHSAEVPLPKTLANAKESATLNLGEVTGFIVNENGIPLDTATILSLLGAPSEFVRNATGVMVGIHAFDHNQPFLLVTVAAYDHAFSAMLAWEERMNEGLGDFFRPSSLGPSNITSATPPLTFTDRTINNIDVRESQPGWRIMYTFLRPDLLLITTNDSTLREVVTRLSLQSSR